MMDPLVARVPKWQDDSRNVRPCSFRAQLMARAGRIGVAVAAVVLVGLTAGLLARDGLRLKPRFPDDGGSRTAAWVATVRGAAGARADPSEPQEQPPQRMIITGRDTEDISWILLRLGDTPATVYQFVPNIEEHNTRCMVGLANQTVLNRPLDCPAHAAKAGGRENLVYLEFITSHYDRLPAKMLFLHPHETAWHRHDFVNLFQRLKWDSFEFANIRHWNYRGWPCDDGTHDPCGSALTLMLTPTNPSASGDSLLNEGDRQRSWAQHQSRCVAEFWGRLYQDKFGEMPDQIMEPACCAEFLVTRERVLMRPLSFYENARDVVKEVVDTGAGHNIAVAMESMWHAVFGEPLISQAVYRCDLYECSDEEASDPSLVPPPILDPFVLYHRRNDTDARKLRNGTAPA